MGDKGSQKLLENGSPQTRYSWRR